MESAMNLVQKHACIAVIGGERRPRPFEEVNTCQLRVAIDSADSRHLMHPFMPTVFSPVTGAIKQNDAVTVNHGELVN